MKSAPVTGITLCTHLGRHSGTHFDIGLAVITQFPGRKGRWNRKVARSAEKYCLTKVYAHLQLTTRRWRNERRGSSAGKGFGRYRARTMNQKMEKWSHSFLKNSRRYTVERPPLHQHRLAPSSLDGLCQWCPVPLRVENSWKQSVTHTHTHQYQFFMGCTPLLGSTGKWSSITCFPSQASMGWGFRRSVHSPCSLKSLGM